MKREEFEKQYMFFDKKVDFLGSWISVNDKLPDEYPVLVLDSHGSMCVIHDSATTYSNCCGCHFGEYSHWMQLPTPPEGIV